MADLRVIYREQQGSKPEWIKAASVALQREKHLGLLYQGTGRGQPSRALQSDTQHSCLEHSDLIPAAWQTAPHRGTALQQTAQNRAGEREKELPGCPALPWLFRPAEDESCTEPERKKCKHMAVKTAFTETKTLG